MGEIQLSEDILESNTPKTKFQKQVYTLQPIGLGHNKNRFLVSSIYCSHNSLLPSPPKEDMLQQWLQALPEHQVKIPVNTKAKNNSKG